MLVSLTSVADTNSDESLQLFGKSCRNGCTNDFSAVKPRDSGNARKEVQKNKCSLEGISYVSRGHFLFGIN